jgi:hypothetical protein
MRAYRRLTASGNIARHPQPPGPTRPTIDQPSSAPAQEEPRARSPSPTLARDQRRAGRARRAPCRRDRGVRSRSAHLRIFSKKVGRVLLVSWRSILAGPVLHTATIDFTFARRQLLCRTGLLTALPFMPHPDR